jgi:hypothetical protein
MLPPVLEVLKSLDERLDLLVDIYGEADRQELIIATQRIRKRLGGQRTQAAVEAIEQEDLRTAFAIILDYYDRTYRYDLERRNKTIPQVDLVGLSPAESAPQTSSPGAKVVGELSKPRPVRNVSGIRFVGMYGPSRHLFKRCP